MRAVVLQARIKVFSQFWIVRFPDVTECIWLSELIHLTELPISIFITGGENSSGLEEIITVLLRAVVFEVGFDSTEYCWADPENMKLTFHLEKLR